MPNINLGTASVAIRARDAGLTQVARQSADSLRRVRTQGRQLNSTLRTLNRVGQTTNRVLATLGVAAIAGRLQNVAGEAASLGASLVEAANTAGLSVEEFQILQRTFEGDGVAATEFRSAVTFLQRRLGDLERGVPTVVEYFEDLGLSWDQIQGRDISSILSSIADGLRAVEDPNLRVAIATQLLGRSAADMVTVLQNGSEVFEANRQRVEALGVTSTQAAENLKALDQVFTDIGNVLQDQVNEAVGELAPELERLNREWAAITVSATQFGIDAVRASGGISDLLINILAIPAALYAYRIALRGLIALNRSLGATGLATAAGMGRIAYSAGVLAARLIPLVAIYEALTIAGDLWLESQRNISEETARSTRDVDLLGTRLNELSNRIADFGTGQGFGGLGQLLNLPGLLLDLREAERIFDRLIELRPIVQAPAPPGLPPGYDPETGQLSAAADRSRAEAEESERQLNEFVEARIALYRRLADLRRQVEIPAADAAAVTAPVDALEQIQQATLAATQRSIEAQGDLNDEVQTYVGILSAARNDRFVENQLIEIGTRRAEQSLRAQQRAGEITQEVAEASLIVNQRIAELTSRRLLATGEERAAIEATLDDLRTRYPEIVQELAAALDGLTERLTLQAEVLQTVTQGFARGLERGIVRAVRQGGRLLDIFQRIGQEILGTILSALTRIGINALFGAIGLPGFATRHQGGIVRPGQLYGIQAGERFIPSTAGTVVRAASADAPSLTFNIDARGGDEASFNRAITRALPEIAEAVGASTQAEIRFGLNNPSSIYRRAA